MKMFSTIGRIGALGLAAGLASGAAADISNANFDSTTGLKLNGLAVQSVGLPGDTGKTLTITPPQGNSAGSVFTTARQSVAGGFVTEFTFRIRDKMGSGADGLAFVIQNDSRGAAALGGRGGAMGFSTNPWFPTDAGPGLKSSVAIAFDTWDNTGDWQSITGSNIITVQTAPSPLLANQPSSNYSIAQGQPSGAFNDGTTHQVRIVYVPGQLSVYYDQFVTPVVQAQLFLDTQLTLTNGSAFLGFTAATGGAQNSQRHEIISWSMGALPAPTSASLLALGGLCAARRRRS